MSEAPSDVEVQPAISVFAAVNAASAKVRSVDECMTAE